MDSVTYGQHGDWPVGPDGSGVSLAKQDEDSASGSASSWTVSALVGGSPGRRNFPTTPFEVTNSDLGWLRRLAGQARRGFGQRVGFELDRQCPGGRLAGPSQFPDNTIRGHELRSRMAPASRWPSKTRIRPAGRLRVGPSVPWWAARRAVAISRQHHSRSRTPISDGSGVSLAKQDEDSASGSASSWTVSALVGGSPGRRNFPTTPFEVTNSDLGWLRRLAGQARRGFGQRVGFELDRQCPGGRLAGPSQFPDNTIRGHEL